MNNDWNKIAATLCLYFLYNIFCFIYCSGSVIYSRYLQNKIVSRVSFLKCLIFCILRNILGHMTGLSFNANAIAHSFKSSLDFYLIYDSIICPGWYRRDAPGFSLLTHSIRSVLYHKRFQRTQFVGNLGIINL